MAVTTVLRRIAVVVVAGGMVTGGVIAVKALRHHATPPPSCAVGIGADAYTLDIDQAANSTTIAAVGKRLGLPDHAVTVALATALQESKLRNLQYGDRDSLGLFQQRPSQGWGTSTEILTPSYAAAAFYRALANVDGWESLPITDAAQKVQRSGAPLAYAKWEAEARTLASAMTGEQEAALTCRFKLDRASTPAPTFTSSMKNELGVASLDAAFAPPKGWTVASWIVAHAQQYRVTTVSFHGQEWRASSGTWRAKASADDHVRFVQQQPET